jgi:uncharacterized membrane protein
VTSLLLACAFFLLIHFAVSGTRLRDALVARLGERPYRGAFSLASLIGLLWMGRAYARAPAIELWGPLQGLHPVAFLVVFVGVLFVVVGLASANPTRVGMEGSLTRGAEGVRGITRITRHPFLWGVSLWALVHVTVNGDRNRLGPALREIGLVRPAIAIAVYVLIFTLHGRVIGVPLT